MSTSISILVILLALLLGLAIGYLWAQARNSSLRSGVAILETRLQEKERLSAELLAEKQTAYEKSIADQEQNFRLAMERERQVQKESLDALQQRFDETLAKMKAEVETQTEGMLKQRQSEFESSSRKAIETITAPLNVSLQEMKKAVADNTEKHTLLGGQLSENIKEVIVQADAARRSTEHLANVLRAGARIQGNLGETILAELLTSSGLTEGRHFDTQRELEDMAGNKIISDKGSKLQPDVIVHLDGDRDVIIDAKVSLTAFIDYANAKTDEMRASALQRHVASLENQVKLLADKGYADYRAKGKTSMGFVIMFVPYSAALRLALDSKPELWRNAMNRNVFIADEESLFAALKIIAMTWKQMDQVKNQEKVYALANEMVDRVQAFLNHFNDARKNLESASKSLDKAYAKLQDQGQSIPGTCKKLIKLGAQSNRRKKLPDLLLDVEPSADEEEISDPAPLTDEAEE